MISYSYLYKGLETTIGMAKRLRKRTPAPNHHHPRNHCSPGWYIIKGLILLVLGLALWRGLSLEMVFSILFVLAGIKYLFIPLIHK